MRALTTLLIGGLALLGCAATDFTVETVYDPVDDASIPVPSPRDVVWRGMDVNPTVRNQPSAVGVKKGGAGIAMAFVYTNPEPRLWLQAAVDKELGAVGLRVADGPLEAPTLFVLVDQFFVEPDVGFWGAEVTAVTILEVTVTLPRTGRTYQRRFVGEHGEFHLAWTDSVLEEHLVMSAHLALQQAMRETRALIDREDA